MHSVYFHDCKAGVIGTMKYIYMAALYLSKYCHIEMVRLRHRFTVCLDKKLSFNICLIINNFLL